MGGIAMSRERVIGRESALDGLDVGQDLRRCWTFEYAGIYMSRMALRRVWLRVSRRVNRVIWREGLAIGAVREKPRQSLCRQFFVRQAE